VNIEKKKKVFKLYLDGLESIKKKKKKKKKEGKTYLGR